jgi:hypothetical protein
VSSRWPTAVHVGTEIVRTWSSKCRICDAFRVQAKPNLLRVVLRYWKRARDDFRLVSVSPAMLVLVRIICACRLQSLEICEVEDLLGVGDELAFFEIWHGVLGDTKLTNRQGYYVG